MFRAGMGGEDSGCSSSLRTEAAGELTGECVSSYRTVLCESMQVNEEEGGLARGAAVKERKPSLQRSSKLPR